MNIAYCKNCNRFSYISRKSNYCRECNAPIMMLDMSEKEFFELSLNERYRLAYKLTNDENSRKKL